MFDKDPLTALEAITAAQHLAFAPLAFQATAALRDRGVLDALAEAVPDGLGIDEVAAATGLQLAVTTKVYMLNGFNLIGFLYPTN